MTQRTLICIVLFFPLFMGQTKIWESVRGTQNYSGRRGTNWAFYGIMLLTIFELLLISKGIHPRKIK